MGARSAPSRSSLLSRSRVEVDIDVASIDTHEAQRDAHLRSGDFFEVEKHPTITFRSKRVEASAAFVAGPWRYEQLEGVSHWIPLEAADRLNGLLLEWLTPR